MNEKLKYLLDKMKYADQAWDQLIEELVSYSNDEVQTVMIAQDMWLVAQDVALDEQALTKLMRQFKLLRKIIRPLRFL